MRPALAPLALCVIIFAGSTTVAPARGLMGDSAFDRIEQALKKRVSSKSPEADRQEAYVRLNQIRNHQAISEMLAKLPAPLRPSHILYAASGDHMAPLVACADDPGTRPFSFLYTEVDPGVREGISGFLNLLVREGVASKLSSGPPPPGKPGSYVWSFRLGRHPVSLTLVLNPQDGRQQSNRLYPAWALAQSELVITHDWAGDQQENLRLVWELLQSVRTSGAEKAPLMMMEDLERHPYPVDLSFFSPLARTDQPYGHRQSLPAQAGAPPGIELGAPLYGGGVLLGFTDSWWKGLDDTALMAAFNFLLFNEFDNERLNVFTGGPDPVLAPPLLDWISGYGTRAIDGRDVRDAKAIKLAMVEKAPALASLFPEKLRSRWACRMILYRALLEMEAASTPFDDLLPSARWKRRAGDPDFPFANNASANLFREALQHADDYSAAKRSEHEEAARTFLPFSRASAYDAEARRCETGGQEEWPKYGEVWHALYLSTRNSIQARP